MIGIYRCEDCSAFWKFCEGSAKCAADCRGLEDWLDPIGGLALDAPFAPHPWFDLPPFFPERRNGPEVSSMPAREPAVAVGIAKTLTPRGRVSHRAIPAPYSTRSLRAQWVIDQDTLLLCFGSTLDGYLERLWSAHVDENTRGHLRALGFDAATSLNFSIYLDRPRLERLVNLKRSWLTVRRMQETSDLFRHPPHDQTDERSQNNVCSRVRPRPKDVLHRDPTCNLTSVERRSLGERPCGNSPSSRGQRLRAPPSQCSLARH